MNPKSDGRISLMAWVLAAFGVYGLWCWNPKDQLLAVALLFPAALVAGGLAAVVPAFAMEHFSGRVDLVPTALRHVGWSVVGAVIGSFLMFGAFMMLAGGR